MSDTEHGTEGDDPGEGGSTRRVSRRRLLASVTATAAAGRALATPVGAASAGAAGDDATVRESAWVETPVDTDEDGRNDRVYVRVSRPASTDEDERVPVIGTASPYYGEQTHGDTTEAMLYDRTVELRASERAADTATGAADGRDGERVDGRASTGGEHRPRPRATSADPLSTVRRLERRYLPRGYAVARISSLGTDESTGCYTAAGPETVTALEAVVDWFNGRATAYDAREGGETVTADWTTGKTGLIGASANGELANGVATTGVDGLEAVVPQAANNGQFSLFRSNGTPVSVIPSDADSMIDLGSWIQASNALREDCAHWTDRVEAGQDRVTGDYNDFWHEREFLTDADAVDCAVLLTHAVDDPIVKPNNVADWYAQLRAAGVPVKLWLHEGGHTSPEGQAWREFLDRWWAHWLKGEDTGVMDEPRVTVVHNASSAERGTVNTHEDWPVPGTEPAAVRFTAGGRGVGGATLGDPDGVTESFVDDPTVSASQLVEASGSDHRLRYETPRLTEPVRVSGKVVASLSLSFDDPTVVSVALVAYRRRSVEIIARGWADPLNRPRYGDYDSPVAYKQSLRESAPVASGERVRVEFPLQATDQVFEPGRRIGLVVYASDSEFTLHPPGRSRVTLSLAESGVSLPVVGGPSALSGAFETPAPTASDPTATETAGRSTASATAASSPPAAETDPTDADSTGDGTTSGSGPGLGVVGTLAGLAGGVLLGRRGDDGR